MLTIPRWCVHCGHAVSRRRRRFCDSCGLPFRWEHRQLRQRFKNVGERLTRVDKKDLAPGEVVKPGTWGRAARRGNARACEDLLERIRAAEYPERPSRFAVAFAYEGVPRDHPPDMGNHVNLVRRERNALAFRADMSWVGYCGLDPSSAEAATCARRYWSGSATPQPTWEWLIEGPLEVIGPVPLSPLPHARPRRVRTLPQPQLIVEHRRETQSSAVS